MEIFLVLIIFIMGTFFGSFFTLAVYRIPLKKDITHEHSFCPNCNHKLGVLDLIPVWSYIFLGGKCRYCGEKIRIRYLILEVLSGLVFVISYLSLKIDLLYLEIDKIIYFISFVFAYITCVLVAGIDKEIRKINSSILLFGAICQLIYILYLCVVLKNSVYRYIIYFLIFIVMFIIIKLIERNKKNYLLEIILLISYILLVVDYYLIVPTIVLSAILAMILSIISKEKYGKISKSPIGFVLGMSTICNIIVNNFIIHYLK